MTLVNVDTHVGPDPKTHVSEMGNFMGRSTPSPAACALLSLRSIDDHLEQIGRLVYYFGEKNHPTLEKLFRAKNIEWIGVCLILPNCNFVHKWLFFLHARINQSSRNICCIFFDLEYFKTSVLEKGSLMACKELKEM